MQNSGVTALVCMAFHYLTCPNYSFRKVKICEFKLYVEIVIEL